MQDLHESLRLLGNVAEKRVLVLGVTDASSVVALAVQGARVAVVDPHAGRLEGVRARCDEAEVRMEAHQADLADLAFLRADSVDAALSIGVLAGVDDFDRVLRQVHRVMRPEAPFVVTLPHPAAAVAEGASYFDPMTQLPGMAPVRQGARPIGEVFSSFGRANFRVDSIGEPEPAVPGSRAPLELVIRAKKEGT